MIPISIQTYCKKQAIDLTPIRKVLLEHLWSSGSPAKAYDMIDTLREKEIGAPKPSTVYRTLDYLSEFGLLHKIHSLNAYMPCHHPGKHHDCHLLICDMCKQVQEFCDPEIAKKIPDKVKTLGFLPGHIVVEVYGTCASCQKSV